MLELSKIKDLVINSEVDISYHSVQIKMQVKEILGVVNISLLENNEIIKPYYGNLLGIFPIMGGKKRLVIDCRKNKNKSKNKSGEIALHVRLETKKEINIEAILVFNYEDFKN